MRVLFVVPYAPSQIRVRPYGFIRHLARQHDVNVLALETGSLKSGALTDMGELRREGIPVTIIREPRYKPYLRTLKSALVPRRAPLPLQVAYTASPALRAAITAELRARDYDVVHVEHVRGLGALPDTLGVPAVWDAVDCVSLLFTEGARHAAEQRRLSPIRVVGPLEARRLAAFERERISRFRQVLVTSVRDRQALLDLAGARDEDARARKLPEITVLPHGIDWVRFHPCDIERQPDTLVFSGKMDYHANVAGALQLAHEIMPLVWQQRPEARLIIAGNKPPRAVRHLAGDPRITVTGYVRDLNALVGSASVAVSPLPYAVGIQNKVLEAMASGTPVVASTSAAQGLQAMPGRDLLVAETAEDLAAAVLRLLDNADLRASVGANGERYVAAHHSWDAIIARLTAVYERARAADGIAAQALAVSANGANGANGVHGMNGLNETHGANGRASRAPRDYVGGWKARRERTQPNTQPNGGAGTNAVAPSTLAAGQDHTTSAESAQ